MLDKDKGARFDHDPNLGRFHQLPRIEGGAPTIDELKADLRTKCEGVPFTAWLRFFPDLQIPLGQTMESSQLPAGIPFGSHEFDGKGNSLAVRHTIGHDVVETFLVRNGKILEKLVHYGSDGPDSEKRYPDEVLGEASDEQYQWAHGIAVSKLDWLNKKAAEMSSPVEQSTSR